MKYSRGASCRRDLEPIMQLTSFAQPSLSAQRALSAHVEPPSRTPRTAPCTASRPLTVISFLSPSPSPTTYNMSGAGCRAAPPGTARRARPGTHWRAAASQARRCCGRRRIVQAASRRARRLAGGEQASRARRPTACRARAGARAGTGARARAGAGARARAAWRVGTRTPPIPLYAQLRLATRSSWRGCSARGAM